MDPRLHRRPEPEREPSELVSNITYKFGKQIFLSKSGTKLNKNCGEVVF